MCDRGGYLTDLTFWCVADLESGRLQMSWKRVARAWEESEDGERKVVTRCGVIRLSRECVRVYAVKEDEQVVSYDVRGTHK